MGILNEELYIRSIYENGKEHYIYLRLQESYIYLSTTNTILHGKSLLHIKFYIILTNRVQSYHQRQKNHTI